MVTAVERVLDRWTKGKERYEQWERRHVAARFASWSVRRRLTTFVLLPIMLTLCCGLPIGVPVLLFGRATVEAGRGSPAPDAAANEYLMALSYGTEDGLLPLLDDERQGDLLDQWRGYLTAMRSADPPPSRLDFGALTVGPTIDGRAEVRADVEVVWWDPGQDGRMTGYNCSARTWVIDTREDNGWRVSRVTAPPWCGAGGYLPRCPGDPAPAPSAQAPSAPPSPDLLQHPREMLRCGKRDPFREMHSCPPNSPGPSSRD